MEISNSIRSQILSDALPHIQKYHNKIVVVKYGGNAMTNDELKEAVMRDIVLLSEASRSYSFTAAVRRSTLC